MKRLLQNRLVLQLVFTLIAATSVAALSAMLIVEAVGSAEGVVVSETNRTLTAALSELKQQYQYRIASDSSWAQLPLQARDVSMRGLVQTVLRSYPGVEGGLYGDREFLGYAFPTHDNGDAKVDVPSAERDSIIALAEQSRSIHRGAERLIRGQTDLLVLGAEPTFDQATVVWVMKRLAGRANAGAGRREFLLGMLVFAALVSIVGTLATGIELARGVSTIKAGLLHLEEDFDYRLPQRADELGSIMQSINRMASVRSKLEAELRREDRLRALGRLAAGLAHEIRNPLNSIRLTVQLMEHKLQSASIKVEDLQTVRSEVDRLNVLLTDLLDLQRSRQPCPLVQPVVPVLQHCVALVERQADTQKTGVFLETGFENLNAYFDSQQLTQAVVNLLLNALEVSPAGSSVRIRIVEEQREVRIEVSDAGPGLNREQREHLFEPFYTTKPAGVGLGLAVSRELMRSNGGDLQHARSGVGACFVVQLPRNGKS